MGENRPGLEGFKKGQKVSRLCKGYSNFVARLTDDLPLRIFKLCCAINGGLAVADIQIVLRD